MADREVDILINGGGLTGAVLLLALQNQGFKTLMVEARPFHERNQPDLDGRSLALSPASIQILNQLGIWPHLKKNAAPIKTIHVSQQKRFGRVLMKTADPLGYVIEMHAIQTVLHELIPKEQLLCPASLTEFNPKDRLAIFKKDDNILSVQARLFVAADGSDSLMRRLSKLAADTKDYAQTAVTTNIVLNRDHHHQAFERFTPSGPLALLPLEGRKMSLVWALKPEDAKKRYAESETDFLKALQQNFGYRLGRFEKVGKRFLFPLTKLIMPRQCVWPLVFVGNAAHSLHPAGGQGFNLGLRDVACLAECLVKRGINEPMLNHYEQLRTPDQRLISRFTDDLAELFTKNTPGLGFLRGLGFLALDHIAPLKKSMICHASGFGGIPPDLACSIPLQAEIS